MRGLPLQCTAATVSAEKSITILKTKTKIGFLPSYNLRGEWWILNVIGLPFCGELYSVYDRFLTGVGARYAYSSEDIYSNIFLKLLCGLFNC